VPELGIGAIVADRYRLDRQLGEGGMGVVYAATHMKTRKLVALKILRPAAHQDTATKQRFLREARAACAVRHPNVVEVHDVIELEDELPMIVMELLDGEPLAAKLSREKKIALPELASLLLPVVSAVGTAHEVGIVHRDLKPDNIFLSRGRDGMVDVHVLDFGIAKLTATEGDAARSGAMTGTGAVLGTPYYMSPEQIFGEKDIDHRADVWALGVILYECLSGARPTQAENIGQIFKIVTTGRIKPIQELVPDVDPRLARLVGRMLSREREGRPADLQEVMRVLSAHTSVVVPSFGAPRGATARVSDPKVEAPAGDTVVVTPTHGTAGALDDTVEERKKADARASTQSPITMSQPVKARRRRLLPVMAAVVGVAGAIGVAALFMRSGPTGANAGAPTMTTTTNATTTPTATATATVTATTTGTTTATTTATGTGTGTGTGTATAIAAGTQGASTASSGANRPQPNATGRPPATHPPATNAAPPGPRPSADPASYQ
jgi:serine/threonine protein kinase